MPGLWDRAVDRVPDGTPSDTSQTGKGTTARGGPAATIGLQGLLFAYDGVSGMLGQGMKGGGKEYVQPEYTLFTPSHAGNNSDTGGGEYLPPPLN